MEKRDNEKAFQYLESPDISAVPGGYEIDYDNLNFGLFEQFQYAPDLEERDNEKAFQYPEARDISAFPGGYEIDDDNLNFGLLEQYSYAPNQPLLQAPQLSQGTTKVRSFSTCLFHITVVVWVFEG